MQYHCMIDKLYKYNPFYQSIKYKMKYEIKKLPGEPEEIMPSNCGVLWSL